MQNTNLIPTTKVLEIEQGEGFKKVRTSLQIFDLLKIEQVSQGEGLVKVRIELKQKDQIQVVKVE